MLEVDNRVIIPELTHVRFIVTATDVIHSFACPALGIKCDAYPGRLNQASVIINREGVFYGQCSEICGKQCLRLIKILLFARKFYKTKFLFNL
jgi:cytochrome c oxidase subunit 2